MAHNINQGEGFIQFDNKTTLRNDIVNVSVEDFGVFDITIHKKDSEGRFQNSASCLLSKSQAIALRDWLNANI